MLLFHEGLPGSGKSYAAIKDHLIPALRKGRTVCAYVEGLDHTRIALVAGISEERCRELLQPITREQVPEIWKYVVNDAFVIIDELQNFWPTTRARLGPEITQFITEHRHRGLDVLCMGQVLGDCHTMWRNRVDQNVFFFNRDAIGKPNSYRWSVRKRESNGKFTEVTAGTAEYDPQYFGCYASHSEGTANTERFTDKRANIWSSPIVRRYLPLALGVGVLGLGFVIWLFRGGLVGNLTEKADTALAKDKPAVVQVTPAPVTTPPQAVETASKKIALPVAEESAILPGGDMVDTLTSKYRIRAGGQINSKSNTYGIIEWRDENNGVRDVLTYRDLSGLGWLVMSSPDGALVILTKINRKYYATAWPIEDYRGRVTEAQKRTLEPTSPVVGKL